MSEGAGQLREIVREIVREEFKQMAEKAMEDHRLLYGDEFIREVEAEAKAERARLEKLRVA